MLNLSPELIAQVHDLKGYYGDTPSEIVAHILRNWFHTNRAEVRDTREQIDALHARSPEAFHVDDSEGA